MKRVLVVSVMIVMSTIVFGQIKATTNDGREVLLDKDNTWSFIEKELVVNDECDCSKLISTEVDVVTGKSSVGSVQSLIVSKSDEYGFAIYLVKGGSSIIVSMQVIGAGNCIDDNDKMNILFTDGTRLEMTNMKDFNCENKFGLYLGKMFRTIKQLDMLSTKKVSIMRVQTSKGYVEMNFTDEEATTLMNSFKCINK